MRRVHKGSSFQGGGAGGGGGGGGTAAALAAVRASVWEEDSVEQELEELMGDGRLSGRLEEALALRSPSPEGSPPKKKRREKGKKKEKKEKRRGSPSFFPEPGEAGNAAPAAPAAQAARRADNT